MLNHPNPQLVLHWRHANQDDLPALPERPQPILDEHRSPRCVNDMVYSTWKHLKECLLQVESRRRGIDCVCSAELFGELQTAGEPVDADDGTVQTERCRLSDLLASLPVSCF
jgi:hypothetical protein